MDSIVQRIAVSVWGVLGLVLIGCGGLDGDAAQTCQAAGEHLSQCLNMPVNLDPDACDAEAATMLLDFDCETLTTPPSESELGAAKADNDQCNLTDLCLEIGVEDEALCDSFEETSCTFVDDKMDSKSKCPKGYKKAPSGCKKRKRCPSGYKSTSSGCKKKIMCKQGSKATKSGHCRKQKKQKCKDGQKWVGGSLGCVRDGGVTCSYGEKFYGGKCRKK